MGGYIVVNHPINPYGRVGNETPSVRLWQRNQEVTARIQVALRPNRPSLRLHHMARNRQPQPGPTGLTRSRLVHPVEPFEDPPQMLRRNSRSEVPHAELHHPTLIPANLGNLSRAHHHPALSCVASPAILDPILNQISQ